MNITPPQTAEKPCVYCNTKEIKDRAIVNDRKVWAIPTNIPITPGHTLILPTRCVQTLDQLTAEEMVAILDLATEVMAALKKAFGAEGFNSAFNQGKLAGQSVPHFHLHVIPRKEGDTGLLGYDPRSMLYRTGDREPTPEEDLALVAEQIRNAMC